jgi:thiamine-monophosphate kinase
MARPKRGQGEFGVIARVFAPLASHPGAFGLRDDAAKLPQKAGTDLVVTKDAIVEGVHFLPSDPADLVARKLLRVNVSDLAAKGARPAGYFLAVGFPGSGAAAYAAAFGKGLARDNAVYGLQLFGGDTVVTPGPMWFSCTMFGHAPRGRIIRRNGAKPGDDVWVTGTIGDSGAGLALWQGAAKGGGADTEWLKGRYRLPQPPVEFGLGLHGIATAALDVSDGLLQDAGHLAQESSVALQIFLDAIPLSPQNLRASGDSAATRIGAVQAGDDYQILFAAPARKRTTIESLGVRNIVRVTRIGVATSGKGVALLDGRGRKIKLARAGYTHF